MESNDELIDELVGEVLSRMDSRFIAVFNAMIEPRSTSTSIRVRPTRMVSRRLTRLLMHNMPPVVPVVPARPVPADNENPNTISESILDLMQVEFVKNETECSICLDSMRHQHCKRLPCDHVFHSHCIDNWLLNRSSQCPLCRVFVDADKK